MRTMGIFAGIALAAMGLVWTLQGLNSTLAPQSFMTGSRTWVVIGLITLAVGSALAVWSFRRRE